MRFAEETNVVVLLREDLVHAEDVVTDGVGGSQTWAQDGNAWHNSEV